MPSSTTELSTAGSAGGEGANEQGKREKQACVRTGIRGTAVLLALLAREAYRLAAVQPELEPSARRG